MYTPRSMFLLALATAPVTAQTPLPARAGEEALIAAILAAQRHREAAFAQVALTLTASASVYHGQAQAPPLLTKCAFAMAEGRVLQRIDGVDLDGGGSVAAGERAVTLRIDRLMLHGGNTETWDPVAREFRFGALKFRAPAAAWSLVSPGDLVWSFSGAMRLEVLGQRDLAIVSVVGAAPQRVVRLAAASRVGAQRFEYECAEAWGWLPRRAESWDGESEPCLSFHEKAPQVKDRPAIVEKGETSSATLPSALC